MNVFNVDDEYQYRLNPVNKIWDLYRLGEFQPKSVSRLFKYFSLNLFSIDALLRGYFYLANPCDFNDPFDCNLNLINDLEETDRINGIKQNSFSNIGICSFSETLDNHLMWAHYTNNYNGFVLEFDGNNVDVKISKNTIKRHTLTRVIYPEKPITVSKDCPIALHYLLTSKFSHWQYEKEWRIICDLLSEDRELIYFSESIKGVYIGHNILDTNKSAYKLLLEIMELKMPEVPIYVVYPHKRDLRLEFEKVWN